MTTSPSQPPPLSDRYIAFINQTVASTLKGQIRSKEHVYQLLVEHLEPGTGEVFERCLEEQTNTLRHQFTAETDELKRAKAERQVRAIKTLQDAWQQWQRNHQAENACTKAVQQIRNAEAPERLSILIQILDPNQTYVFNRQHIQQLAEALPAVAETLSEESEAFELRQFAEGLTHGLASFRRLEEGGHIGSWISDPERSVGISLNPTRGPWSTWARHVGSPLPQELFTSQAHNQSAVALAQAQRTLDLSTWVELAVLLRGLQNALVSWFDRQPYHREAGNDLAGVTHMVFAVIWCELSKGFRQAQHLPERDRQHLSQACFQITLQILRTFAQRENFPLYGGVFVSFSGENFRDTITYLDQPLNAVENTQEKARILTVLGHSQYWLGQREPAIVLHQSALQAARQTGDQRCEIANLNHLSRLSLHQKNYSRAVDYAQRALILARQIGEQQGRANALVNFGYSEVMIAQRQEAVTPEQLESPIHSLQQGRELAEKLHDFQSQALCDVGLGIAHVALEQPSQAKQSLERGLSIVERIGDRDLQGLSHAYLGEACYQLNQLDRAVYHACLGMYLLEQRHNQTWQQAAALVLILQGQLGPENFLTLLRQHRSRLIPQIGVDGFDYLPALVEHYRQG